MSATIALESVRQSGIAELLAALQSQGIGYKDLRTSESSLEDIFVSLVHEETAR